MAMFSRGKVVAVVRLAGPIGLTSPLRPGLSMAGMAGILERAFTMKGVKAVALQINSPGGSPVQSTLLFKRIRLLARTHKLPVYVFAEDAAASGGYLLALAGDEIYAEGSSIIGSIGVISAGFGFVELIDKIGVDRRVYTSGEKKMMLDPFQPENPEDIARLKALQADVHEQFIALVKSRRGEKIAAAGDRLFTGEFWSGNTALELGLIDGISDLRSKMQEKFGDKVKLKMVEEKRGLFRKLPFLATTMRAAPAEINFSLAEDLLTALQTRKLWQRFGL